MIPAGFSELSRESGSNARSSSSGRLLISGWTSYGGEMRELVDVYWQRSLGDFLPPKAFPKNATARAR